jgi:hypothetical protein
LKRRLLLQHRAPWPLVCGGNLAAAGMVSSKYSDVSAPRETSMDEKNRTQGLLLKRQWARRVGVPLRTPRRRKCRPMTLSGDLRCRSDHRQTLPPTPQSRLARGWRCVRHDGRGESEIAERCSASRAAGKPCGPTAVHIGRRRLRPRLCRRVIDSSSSSVTGKAPSYHGTNARRATAYP